MYFFILLNNSFALPCMILYNKTTNAVVCPFGRCRSSPYLINKEFRMHKLRHSIQARVILLVMAFTALIALAVCGASVAALYKSTVRSTAQSAEYNLQIAAGRLRQDVEEIDSLADWATVNSTVRNYLFSSYQRTQILDIYNTILSKYSSQHTARYIRRFIITNCETGLMQQGTAVSQSMALSVENLNELPGFEDAQDSDSWTILAEDPLITVGSASVIPVIRNTKNFTTNQTARVYIAVSSALITDAVQDYTLPEDAALYFIMDGRPYRIDGGAMISADVELTNFPDAALEKQYDLLDNRTVVFQVNGENALAYPLGSSGLYVAQTLPKAMVTSQLPAMMLPLTAAFCMILLLGLLLGLLLRQMISVPVQALQDQLRRIGQGDFTPNPAIEWDNEMGDIGRGINGLSRSVTGLMEHRLEDERQKKDLEYRMLQNQINPHFIYNTLNSIKWMATIQHAPGIAEMTMALSRLLKSVSKGNERLVPLQEEFALLNDYFTIQQYRYGGTITMDVTYIEDERLCRDCMIPRFTLQPLVENAIFHGIEPKGCAGNIEILVLRDTTGDVLIDLKDDGVGMSPEQAAKALSEPGPEEAAAKFRHVGMWNVHRRLQYSFGEGYGLSIRSEPGKGTVVTVRLPPTESQKGGNS